MLNAATPEFLRNIAENLGPDVITAPSPAYLTEPRGRYHGQAAAVLRPRNTPEVAQILRLCHAAKVGVVPFAGGTGLVGGQISPDGPAPIVLSVERLTRIRAVDAANNSLTAEAGVILADIQQAAAGVNRLFPLALASEGSCRIGGNLATNAGGVQVLRYGNTRDLTLGIEAVMADGTVIKRLGALRKDNTGYDLRHLLIGSEGTLGVITAATLKLFARPSQVETAFVAVPSPQAALDLLHHVQAQLGDAVTAFELISAQGAAFLAEHMPQLRLPFSPMPDWMVLCELNAGAGDDLRARAEAMFARAFEAGVATDAVIAQSEAQRAAFWAVRETIPLANKRVGAISSHDISVPMARIPEFIEAGPTVIARIDPALRINCFGHLGDGNLHYNVFPPTGRDRAEYDPQRGAVKSAVHDLVHEFGGSVSAEHGIGRLKSDDLATYGDPGALMAMRAIKAALDPHGIMNPGAILSPL